MFERSCPVLLPETFTLKINMTSATEKVLVLHMSLLGCVCGKRCTVAERATYQIHRGFELLELVEEVTSIRRLFVSSRCVLVSTVAAPPRKKILICKIFWNMTRPTAVSFIVSVMYGCLVVTQVFLSDPKTTRFIPCVHFCESQVVNSIIYGVKVLQIWRFVDDRRWGTIANRRRDTIRFPVESMKDCLNFPETMTDLLVQKKIQGSQSNCHNQLDYVGLHVSISSRIMSYPLAFDIFSQQHSQASSTEEKVSMFAYLVSIPVLRQLHS